MEESYSFSHLKAIYDTYFLAYAPSGEEIAVNKETRTFSKAEELIDSVRFINAWFNSIVTIPYVSVRDENSKYKYAFGFESAITYKQIMRELEKQLQDTGNIEPKEVYNYLRIYRNGLGLELMETLFNDEEYLRITDKWARRVCKDAKEPTRNPVTLNSALKESKTKVL